MATSLLPSRGPTRGRNSGATPALSEVPNAKCGEKIRSGFLTPTISGAEKRAEVLRVLRNPCILRDPQRQAQGEIQKWLAHPCILKGPQRGRKCYVTPAFLRVPYRGKSSTGYLTTAFLRAPKRTELRRNPCVLTGQALGENQKWLPQPCLLGGPEEGGSAM